MTSSVRRMVTMAAVVALGLAAPLGSVSAQETGPRSVADLAERLLGSVVNISTSQRVEARRSTPSPETEEDVPFQEFFDEFFDDENRPDPRRVQSLGSGFVISADGVVITNNHVIKDADEVIVNFSNGDKLAAEVVGRDPKTDLAVLRVAPDEPLQPVKFAPSDPLRIGDWVMAIGNPFGLGGTVTVGIISARNRNLQSGPYDDFLQTDAAINRGNSGGPLFDMNGDVVGINTAIISPSGGSIGIGFAIPSEIAQQVIHQLIEYGETRRGWLGVRIQEVTDDVANSLGLDHPTGAMIAGVTEDGPAEKAGIQSGDVVLTFNGREVHSMRELPRIVAETEIGRNVDVTVLRSGEQVVLSVEVGELLEEEARAIPVSATPDDEAVPADDEAGIAVLGMELKSLTDERRQTFSIGEGINGVLVAGVDDQGRAAEKRIVPGDVILEVGQREVSSPQEVEERIARLKTDGRKTALLTLSNSAGDLRFTALRLDE